MSQITSNLSRPYINKVKGSKDSGSNGYHKIKSHGLWLLLHYMEKYRSAINFGSKRNKSFHIKCVNGIMQSKLKRETVLSHPKFVHTNERAVWLEWLTQFYSIFVLPRMVSSMSTLHKKNYKHNLGELTKQSEWNFIGSYRSFCSKSVVRYSESSFTLHTCVEELQWNCK